MMQNSLNSLKNGNFKGPLLQFVRYRKPRWMPTAPSKLFRVPTRPVLPADEAAEWKRINMNYK